MTYLQKLPKFGKISFGTSKVQECLEKCFMNVQQVFKLIFFHESGYEVSILRTFYEWLFNQKLMLKNYKLKLKVKLEITHSNKNSA